MERGEDGIMNRETASGRSGCQDVVVQGAPLHSSEEQHMRRATRRS